MIRWARMITLVAALAALLPLVLDFDSARDLKAAGAVMFARRPDPDLALRLASRALLLGGLDETGRCRAREIRSTAALRLGNRSFALKDLDRVVAACPQRAGALLQRGELRLLSGDPAGALADLDRGITLSTADGRKPGAKLALPYALRGQAHLALGHLEPAKQDAATAIRLGPRQPQAHYVHSLVLEAQGLIHPAWQSMEKAFALKYRPGGLMSFQDFQGDAWTRRLITLRMKNKVDPIRPHGRKSE
jgi:tetratricopeptide (TPR) repeat protein